MSQIDRGCNLWASNSHGLSQQTGPCWVTERAKNGLYASPEFFLKKTPKVSPKYYRLTKERGRKTTQLEVNKDSLNPPPDHLFDIPYYNLCLISEWTLVRIGRSILESGWS